MNFKGVGYLKIDRFETLSTEGGMCPFRLLRESARAEPFTGRNVTPRYSTSSDDSSNLRVGGSNPSRRAIGIKGLSDSDSSASRVGAALGRQGPSKFAWDRLPRRGGLPGVRPE